MYFCHLCPQGRSQKEAAGEGDRGDRGRGGEERDQTSQSTKRTREELDSDWDLEGENTHRDIHTHTHRDTHTHTEIHRYTQFYFLHRQRYSCVYFLHTPLLPLSPLFLLCPPPLLPSPVLSSPLLFSAAPPLPPPPLPSSSSLLSSSSDPPLSSLRHLPLSSSVRRKPVRIFSREAQRTPGDRRFRAPQLCSVQNKPLATQPNSSRFASVHLTTATLPACPTEQHPSCPSVRHTTAAPLAELCDWLIYTSTCWAQLWAGRPSEQGLEERQELEQGLQVSNRSSST